MDTVTQNEKEGNEPTERFVRVPRSLVKDKRLKAYDFATYIAIANVKPDPAGYRLIGFEGLAKAALMARSTAQESVKRLVALGHIALDGGQETNRYVLTSPLYGKVPASLTTRESTKRRFVPSVGTAGRYDDHTARRYHIRIESNNTEEVKSKD